MEYVVAFIALIVAVLIVVQILIRKHFVFNSSLCPQDALRAAAGAIGGGQSYIDASGALSIPLTDTRILSVHAEPYGSGSIVEVWLSSYDFLNANGFQVIGYRSRAKRIKNACGA
jgi:hypothetical protein